MAQETEDIQFTTEKNLDEIANALRDSMSKTKAYDMQPLQSNQDALGSLGQEPEVSADIEVVIAGHVGRMGGMKHLRFGSARDDWAVQVYVVDLGDQREVVLLALGEKTTGSDLLWGAPEGRLNLGASREKAEIIRRFIEA